MAIEEVVRKVLIDEHADVLRESVAFVAEQIMEAEVSELIGAERGERDRGRATHETATARGAGTRAPASSSCRSRSCAAGRTSRAS